MTIVIAIAISLYFVFFVAFLTPNSHCCIAWNILNLMILSNKETKKESSFEGGNPPFKWFPYTGCLVWNITLWILIPFPRTWNNYQTTCTLVRKFVVKASLGVWHLKKFLCSRSDGEWYRHWQIIYNYCCKVFCFNEHLVLKCW